MRVNQYCTDTIPMDEQIKRNPVNRDGCKCEIKQSKQWRRQQQQQQNYSCNLVQVLNEFNVF